MAMALLPAPMMLQLAQAVLASGSKKKDQMRDDMATRLRAGGLLEPFEAGERAGRDIARDQATLTKVKDQEGHLIVQEYLQEHPETDAHDLHAKIRKFELAFRASLRDGMRWSMAESLSKKQAELVACLEAKATRMRLIQLYRCLGLSQRMHEAAHAILQLPDGAELLRSLLPLEAGEYHGMLKLRHMLLILVVATVSGKAWKIYQNGLPDWSSMWGWVSSWGHTARKPFGMSEEDLRRVDEEIAKANDEARNAEQESDRERARIAEETKKEMDKMLKDDQMAAAKRRREARWGQEEEDSRRWRDAYEQGRKDKNEKRHSIFELAFYVGLLFTNPILGFFVGVPLAALALAILYLNLTSGDDDPRLGGPGPVDVHPTAPPSAQTTGVILDQLPLLSGGSAPDTHEHVYDTVFQGLAQMARAAGGPDAPG